MLNTFSRLLAAGSLALALLGACDDSPPPTLTSEQCEARGGHVIPSPGAPVSCPSGEQLLGNVPSGIEGAICCGR